MSTDYKPYLKTLRRIPAPIVLAMATRELQLGIPESCVCGWAVRESLAFAGGRPAEERLIKGARIPSVAVCGAAAARFGGTPGEWSELYWFTNTIEVLEEAFARRVMECVK